MLVLSRKKSEVLHVGNDIRVIVVEVRGNKVRLAVDAPKSVPILRGELLEQARAAASAAGGNDGE